MKLYRTNHLGVRLEVAEPLDPALPGRTAKTNLGKCRTPKCAMHASTRGLCKSCMQAWYWYRYKESKKKQGIQIAREEPGLSLRDFLNRKNRVAGRPKKKNSTCSKCGGQNHTRFTTCAKCTHRARSNDFRVVQPDDRY